MPPNSTELFQEGAAIKSFKLVSNGVFDEAGITHLLLDIPATYKGCSGTRCIRDNISDLKGFWSINPSSSSCQSAGYKSHQVTHC
jgi:5-oxoprolinase (ATP-hydrolysing)